MTKRLEWQGIELQLLALKVLYIPEYRMLVLSDWHLGKLGHFRKEGLFVPPMQIQVELNRLGDLLTALQVQKVVFLGDLFHASWNHEWDAFISYIQRFSRIDFILTKGNHDLLANELSENTSIAVVDHLWLDDKLVLSHQPLSVVPVDVLNIVGHIHPGVELRSGGRQRFRLPCFYFKDNTLTLPAFGRWTGLYMIKREIDDRMFAIIGNDVIEV